MVHDCADIGIVCAFAGRLYTDKVLIHKAVTRMFAETYQLGGVRVISALLRGCLGQDDDSLRRVIENLPLFRSRMHVT